MESTVIVVGGPNGAGKTTLARQLILHSLPEDFVFLNADLIAEGICPFRPEKAALQAGRVFLRRFDDMARAGRSFVVESTLSGFGLADRLKGLRRIGYRVEIAFLWLPSVEVALQRVAERVKRGGHNVPKAIIARRFARSFPTFNAVYRPVADRWELFDGGATPPTRVAWGRRDKRLEIVDTNRWSRISAAHPSGDETVFEKAGSYEAGSDFYLENMESVLGAMAAFLEEQESLPANSWV